MHTLQELIADLAALGIESSDLVFVHSSYKSLGSVDGGAKTVVAALMKSVGETGLLLMPSFNLVDRDKRTKNWDVESTPSTVGWITEYFRRMPDTYRSDHYSHAVAARGYGAKAFVADHRSDFGMSSPWDLQPWGKTYGDDSPMYRAYRNNGKLLMLGVDYQSSTYVHLVEVMFWSRSRKADPDAKYRFLDREALGSFWDRRGTMRTGRVGDAACRLIRIDSYVDALLAEVERNPDSYTKGK